MIVGFDDDNYNYNDNDDDHDDDADDVERFANRVAIGFPCNPRNH